MTDRAAQLEQIARQMLCIRHPNTTRNYPDFFDQLAPESQERWLAIAEFALSLAEDTRIAAADTVRDHKYDEVTDAITGAFNGALEIAACDIEATPIPIGDAATKETGHD